MRKVCREKRTEVEEIKQNYSIVFNELYFNKCSPLNRMLESVLNLAIVLVYCEQGEVRAFGEEGRKYCFCRRMNEEKGDRDEEKATVSGRKGSGVGAGRGAMSVWMSVLLYARGRGRALTGE
jgi:hypothetical protein